MADNIKSQADKFREAAKEVVRKARNYFKSFQSKTATSTQSELASLAALIPNR